MVEYKGEKKPFTWLPIF